MSTFLTFKLLNTTEFQIAFDYNFSAFTFRSRKFHKYINLHRKDTSKMMQVCRNDIYLNFLDFHPSTIALSIDFKDVYQKFSLD